MVTAVASSAVGSILLWSLPFVLPSDGSGTAQPEAMVAAVSLALFMAMMGIVVGLIDALPSALLLGLIVEVPKAYWLSRRKGHAVFGTAISIVSALAMASAIWWLGPDNSPSIMWQLFGSSPLFPIIVYAIGGAVSAAVWWHLVVVPWRASNKNAEQMQGRTATL